MDFAASGSDCEPLRLVQYRRRQDHRQEKDSINPVKPQYLFVAPEDRLSRRIAQAMGELSPAAPAPALIVDSPFAAQALKADLAQTGWPGRDAAAPLPWCGTLDQAFDAMVQAFAQRSSRAGQAGASALLADLPRPIALRRAQLAQTLLDHRGIAESLGRSSKAALNLAGEWIELFECWEWMAADGQPQSVTQALSQDLALLRELHKQNEIETDRAAWVRALHRDPAWNLSLPGLLHQGFLSANAVWFCTGRTPTRKEVAMAGAIWNLPAAQIVIWKINTPIQFSQDDQFEPQALAALANALPEPTMDRALIASHTLEETAWSAAQTILDWRRQGIEDIGVVPLDRKSVRRLRALLERAGEPFSDRSGWALDTTVAATSVAGLNDLLIGRATTQSVLEWIHSPFVISALRDTWAFDGEARRALDSALRGFGRVAPITLDQLLGQARLPFSKSVMRPQSGHSRMTIAQWATHLMDAMDHCGLEASLADDSAGQALLSALQMLAARSQHDRSTVSASLWQALLAEELSQARFVESANSAAVRICSIASLIWQRPNALLVVGADQAQLPERSSAKFFEPKVLVEMGLQNDPGLTESELFAQFLGIWCAPIPMTCIATSEKPDSQTEFSQWIELLALRPSQRIRQFDAAQVMSSFALATPLPAPCQTADAAATVWLGGLPNSVTVSALQSLINCPYQFFVRHLMGLDGVEPLKDESPPTDIGSLLHLVLANATEPHDDAVAWATWLTTQIDAVLARPFFAARRGARVEVPVPKAIARRLRSDAMAIVPALAQWLATRHERNPAAQIVTEHPVTRAIPSLGIEVCGRIDRWESTANSSIVIDFKTSDPKVLKQQVKSDDQDLQLPMYAWLLEPSRAIDDARYIAMRREGISEVSLANEVNRPVHEISHDVMDRVVSSLTAVRSGTPILMLGLQRDATVCQRCTARGICRRDELMANGSLDDRLDDHSEVE